MRAWFVNIKKWIGVDKKINLDEGGIVMFRDRLWIILGLMMSALWISSPGYAQGTPELNKEGHRWVLGTIEKVEAGSFTIKTKEGTARNFGIAELEKERIRNPRVGDFLVMEFDEGNQIIDIDRVASLDLEVKDISELHQRVMGEQVSVDMAKKRVTLKVQGKGKETYQMKDAAATKMASVKPGTVVLLELDEENRMVNDFDIQR